MGHLRRAAAAASPSVITALLLLAPAAVPAQDASRLHVSLGASASYPSGRFNDRADVGAGLMGSVEYDLGQVPFSVRVDASYDRFDLASRYLSRFRGADGGHTGITAIGATGVWHARTGGSLQPYLLAGVGAYRRHLEVDDPSRTIILDPFWGAVETLAPSQVVAESRTVNKVGVSGGLGLRYRIGPASAFLEGRYQTAYTRHRTRYVPVTLGIRW